jgi:hypothetical protein
VLGGTVGIVWLVFPTTTAAGASAVAAPRAGPVAPAAAPQQDGTSADDLVLPLIAVVTAGALAGYGYLRRTRRARTRTTPGGGERDGAGERDGGDAARHRGPHNGSDGRTGTRGTDACGPDARRPSAATTPSASAGFGGPFRPVGTPGRHLPSAALEAQVCEALVLADDCLRTSREELVFAQARSGAEACAPFARAVHQAEAQLTAAFRLRQRYDEGVPHPADGRARQQALAEMKARCEETWRLLDATAAEFDAVRGLDGEQGLTEALTLVERRWHDLSVRAPTTETVMAGLHGRYASTACEPVLGYVEQARSRLAFATARLDRARRAADGGVRSHAAAELRATEAGVAQAAVFLDAVSRFAAELDEATTLVAPALSGAEAARAGAKDGLTGVPAGEVHARILHADAVLMSLRRELTSARPYDPLAVLRRIVAATAPLGAGRTGVLSAAPLLTARSAIAAADAFITTHRGSVGATPRVRLAEARHLLAAQDPAALPRADTLARTARDLAEQDVRSHGNPHAETDTHAPGTASAIRGGILLPNGSSTGTALAYGGLGTRMRRTAQVR